MIHKTFDVVVIGNVGIDTCIYLYGRDIDFSVESNFTENIDYIGQAGGYTSRSYTRLGRKTAFIGYVGNDHNGRFIKEEFIRDGIDTTAVFIDTSGTSRSINFMYTDGRRKNFYDGKGHMHLKPDMNICKDIMARSKLAHFNIPNWARYLLPVAKELGIKIACDIQDTVSVDDPYREDFIKYSDILFFSAVNQSDPSDFIKRFLQINPGLIIVSGMGARGCALGTIDGVQLFPPVDMENPVIDTNGAGDGLASGFLSSYVLDGYSLKESILRGQIVARYTCAQKASTSSLITSEILERYFKHFKASDY